MFEKSFVISLARSHARYQEFVDGYPDNDLFPTPELVTAIDGKLCHAPPGWMQGNPAWGCYRSHMRLIEQALNEQWESILLFEDDAKFCGNFVERCSQYMQAIPKDWGIAYLGGQHLWKRAPDFVNSFVVRPFNVNRTHAFAIHRRAMLQVYRRLMDLKSWKTRFHIDHTLGDLTMEKLVPVYAPTEWLVGQRENFSTIAGKPFEERFWNLNEVSGKDIAVDERPSPNDRSFVAVIGLHRSGSSCFAGVLHRLGVHMGNRFVGCEPDGGYEASELRNLCENAYPFPSTTVALNEKRVRERLQLFVNARIQEATAKGTIAGGKYPHLCAMGSHLAAICGRGLRIIHTNRPLEKSIASLIRREPRRNPKQLEKCQRWLWEKKQEFLSANDHFTIDYEALLQNPRPQIEQVVEYLNLSPTDEQLSTACAYVNPALQHIV